MADDQQLPLQPPPPPPPNPKELRLRHRLPLVWVAVQSGTSESSARIYEIDRTKLRHGQRERLDAVYRELATREP